MIARKSSTCLIFALIFGPVPSAFLAALPSHAEAFDLQGYAAGVLLFYTLSVVPTALVGIPFFMLLKRHEMARWWAAVAVGAITGVISLGVLFLSVPSMRDGSHFALLGALVGGTFWFVYRSCVRSP